MKSHAYHPNFGQVIPYEIMTLPEDPDQQVAVTVERLIDNARQDLSCPWVRLAAAKAFQLGANPRLSPARQAIAGVWTYIKSKMRFQQDEQQAMMLQTRDPRLKDVIEVVIRPSDMARLIEERGQGFEDCDGFTGYAACLLTALGVPVSLCVVAADEEMPNDYSHIYIVAYADGERIALDFSHGPRIGWECPNLGRQREWHMDGCGLFDLLVPIALAIGMFFAVPHLRKALA